MLWKDCFVFVKKLTLYSQLCHTKMFYEIFLNPVCHRQSSCRWKFTKLIMFKNSLSLWHYFEQDLNHLLEFLLLSIEVHSKKLILFQNLDHICVMANFWTLFYHKKKWHWWLFSIVLRAYEKCMPHHTLKL